MIPIVHGHAHMAKTQIRRCSDGYRLSALPLVCFVLLAISGAVLFVRYDVTAAIFYWCMELALFACLAVLAWFYLASERSTLFGKVSPRLALSVCAFSALFSILLEAGTVVGTPERSVLSIMDWSKKEIVLFFFAVFISSSFILLAVKKPALANKGRARAFFAANPVLGIVVLCIVVLSVNGLLAVASTVLMPFLGASFVRTVHLCIVIILGVAPWFIVKPGLYKTVVSFSIAALSLGCFLISALPNLTAVSPDDQIHYARSLGLSYMGDPVFTGSEIELVAVPWVENNSLQFDEVHDAEMDLNDLHLSQLASGEVYSSPGFVAAVTGESLRNISTISYIPCALGLWLGRLLSLPLLTGFALGRLFNLFSYVVVTAVAILYIPKWKSLIATVALLPYAVYLASNYSYDPWVTSFLLLAVALVLRELSKPDERLAPLSVFAITACFFLGLSAKAVYFPLIGMMLFMPASKFRNSKQRKLYVALVILFGILMVCSFTLPMLFSPAVQAGDVRGGEGVSGIGQIRYILNNPMEFLGTLFGFMVNLLAPASSNDYSLSYAYMGNVVVSLPFLSTLPFLCIYTSAFNVEGDSSKNPVTPALRMWILALVVASVSLVCMALYVGYTPVGDTSVAGVQPRYLIPVLVPAFISLCAPRARIDCVSQRFNFSSVIPPVVMILMSFFACLCCVIGR